jgi:hypothetical protein
MPDQLVVITGAGASADATQVYPRSQIWTPPLVTDLFAERESFVPILGFYPDAQTLAPDLRLATRNGSVGLEAYLRDNVLGSSSTYDRRRFASIPLYLQHVFHEVSQHFTTHPVNYDRLINAALRNADEVVFLTLNYDTLLDGRLHLHTPITTLDHYVRADSPWSLIKLHGSINWMRRIHNEIDISAAGHYLELAARDLGEDLDLADEIVFLQRPSVEATRRPTIGGLYYPALSVPLGPEDELNCPPEHIEFATERLTAHDGINVLTVGYSGLDSGLLNLLRESGNSLRSLFVVNHHADAAFEAAERIAQALGGAAHPGMAYPGTFDNFAQSDSLDGFFAQLE